MYRTLSDAVVLDWYISLNDKDRMSTCDVIYSSEENGGNGTSSSTFLLSPFLPRQRTFVLRWLEPDRRHSFRMSCVDVENRIYATNGIQFKTGEEEV